jgi:threonine dehydrogenase-like Zn-dependent dehydrogenase
VSSQIGSLPVSLRDRWTPQRLHDTVIRLYASGRLDPMPLVSHVIPARSAAEAYRLVDSPPPDLVQVILSFADSSGAGRAVA